MKQEKNIITTLIIVISMAASHLLIDIYHIGIKDGKAAQVAAAKGLKK